MFSMPEALGNVDGMSSILSTQIQDLCLKEKSLIPDSDDQALFKSPGSSPSPRQVNVGFLGTLTDCPYNSSYEPGLHEN